MLAHQLLQASGGEAQVRAKLAALFMASNTLSMQNLPASTRSLALQTMTEMQAFFLDAAPQLIALTERAYANNLTEKELSDDIAWLNSESGRSIRQKSTAISTEVILAEGPLVREIIPKMMQKAIDRTCAQAQCSEADKRAIASVVSAALNNKG